MTEDWARRFLATTIGLPTWAATAPDRLAVVSNAGGLLQAWAVDLATGSWREATDQAVGVEQVLVAPDGRIVWWLDASGDERGHWITTSFEGGKGSPLMTGILDGWSMGISLAGDTAAVGIATDEVYRVFVSEGSGPARDVYRHELPAGVGRLWPEGSGGLSADGSLLCIRHSEHGDILHHALRVLNVASGEPVADLDGAGRLLDPVAWSPTGHELLLTSELGPFERPAIWDLGNRERQDIEVDLPGALIPLGWHPDGSSILVRQEHEAVDRLWRLDRADGSATLVADPGGEIGGAAVRPDGEVWLTVSDAARPPRPVTADGREVFAPRGERPPPGRSYRPMWFTNPAGDRIQALVVTPAGKGPFPTVMHVHGGPEWHHRVRWEPETQALVDAGFAVALVNYRGSTGYGVRFRESLIGDIGFPETEDVLACLDTLAAQGVADPSRAFLAGWSWGGYLACLSAGLHPERWRAVFAGIPTGALVAGHSASAPAIRAWERAIMGGGPDEVPELYRERDPMTYVDRVRAPVLVIAGENDSRCPLAGVTPWTDALLRRGIDVELYLYPAGHLSNATDEEIRQVGMIVKFFRRHL